jgi:hypothetical protein
MLAIGVSSRSSVGTDGEVTLPGIIHAGRWDERHYHVSESGNGYGIVNAASARPGKCEECEPNIITSLRYHRTAVTPASPDRESAERTSEVTRRSSSQTLGGDGKPLRRRGNTG